MLLRRFHDDDVEPLAALHGDPHVMRYIDDGRPVSRSVVEQRTLPRIRSEYAELPAGLGCFAAVAKDSGTFLGWFALRPATHPELDEGMELGYRLLPAAWGRGLATEGARAMVGRAFTEHSTDRDVATTMTVNLASRRVLEKTGLHLVRTFFAEFPEYVEGAEHGDVAYALTHKTWTEGTRPGRSAP